MTFSPEGLGLQGRRFTTCPHVSVCRRNRTQNTTEMSVTLRFQTQACWVAARERSRRTLYTNKTTESELVASVLIKMFAVVCGIV
jgi:hypothetical protein